MALTPTTTGTPETLTGLTPQWQIIYNGADITKALSANFKELTYEEHLSGKACHLDIAFADPLGTMQAGPPVIGAQLSLSIGYQGQALIPAGTFAVDEYEFEGPHPGDIFHVKCIEASMLQDLRTLRSVAYQTKTLTQIATQIAQRHGYTAVTSAVMPDVQYAYMAQNHESDLAFLHRVANQHGYDFQIRNNQLVMYSRAAIEAQPPLQTVIDKLGGSVKHFRFKQQSLGHRTYNSAQLTYWSPSAKKLWTGSSNDAPNINSSDMLKAVERVENNQQAAVKAEAYLHAHNVLSVKAEVVMVGTMGYRAGNVVNVKNFGIFDTVPYIVDKVVHTLNRQGYLTRVELRTKLPTSNTGTQQTFVTHDGKQYTINPQSGEPQYIP